MVLIVSLYCFHIYQVPRVLTPVSQASWKNGLKGIGVIALPFIREKAALQWHLNKGSKKLWAWILKMAVNFRSRPIRKTLVCTLYVHLFCIYVLMIKFIYHRFVRSFVRSFVPSFLPSFMNLPRSFPNLYTRSKLYYTFYQGYKSHTDCVENSEDKRDRMATVLVYLDTVSEGGETDFPGRSDLPEVPGFWRFSIQCFY